MALSYCSHFKVKTSEDSLLSKCWINHSSRCHIMTVPTISCLTRPLLVIIQHQCAKNWHEIPYQMGFCSLPTHQIASKLFQCLLVICQVKQGVLLTTLLWKKGIHSTKFIESCQLDTSFNIRELWSLGFLLENQERKSGRKDWCLEWVSPD